MWVRIRTFDGKKMELLYGLSKVTLIEELKEKIADIFYVEKSKQRLFYRGKQLENGHTLYDYSVGLNEIIQLLIKEDIEIIKSSPMEYVKENEYAYIPIIPGIYKVGEAIDAKDEETGAWFESIVLDYGFKMNTKDNVDTKDIDKETLLKCLVYQVQYIGYEKITDIKESSLRPRSCKKILIEDIKEGQLILANFNIDQINDRGYWYECIIERKLVRRKPLLYAQIFLGNQEQSIENCKLNFLDELYDINLSTNNTVHIIEENIKDIKDKFDEQIKKIYSGKDKLDIPIVDTSIKAIRKLKHGCDVCKDDARKKCWACHCQVCGGKNDLEKQLMCDECDRAWHSYCLDPPLEAFPSSDDDWYCHDCKLDKDEIVKAGESLKTVKTGAFHKTRRSTRSSFKSGSDNGSSADDSDSDNNSNLNSSAKLHHDWGKGMACVGRTKVCTIVPSNHFGPIPGVEVGTLWKFRLQVSEAGVHRPPVSGIHGRENEGAYSIVLSGGYEDDEDFGDEFYYTGSGGRDLSGNKRTAAQSKHQTLTKSNMSLAKNCNCKLDPVKGNEAEDWKSGLPIRVIRNYKGLSKYAPEEGNRYDGIYKIVKYWPQVGKSGFKVWRYILRRDDPVPPPWTEEGQQRVNQLNLTMQYPDGFTSSQTPNLSSNTTRLSGSLVPKGRRGGNKKRVEVAKENCDPGGDFDISGGEEGSSKNDSNLRIIVGSRGRKKRKVEAVGVNNGEAEDEDSFLDTDVHESEDEVMATPLPRKKIVPFTRPKFKLPPVVQKVIDSDRVNFKLWQDCLDYLEEGIQGFLKRVGENFLCICCRELVVQPITTICAHNFCRMCLQRSFKAEHYSCPTCRVTLGKDCKLDVNEELNTALSLLFLGYDKGR